MSNSISIGMVGLGKLGLPVAVSLADKFRVYGYDKEPKLCQLRKYEHKELGPTLQHDFQDYFDSACDHTQRKGQTGLMFCPTLHDLVRYSDVIFVAVQTPHEPKYDGSTQLPVWPDRKDFDYSYLRNVCAEIAPLVKPSQTVVIISTVLPGTIRREILPIFEKSGCKLVYNPFFIAMGTVMSDFYNPEFVLLGSKDGDEGEHLFSIYHNFYKANIPFHTMSYESAELVKVGYNLFISQKLMYINTLMEMAHKTKNCNIEEVQKALHTATDRLLSKKYLTGGMVDGGACHPRDAIAMAHYANQIRLSYNPFEEIIISRERQTRFLISLVKEHYQRTGLPITILGKAFKPETAITAGSAAMLAADLLGKEGLKYSHYDPFLDGMKGIPEWPKGIYLIACKHNCFGNYYFAKGSIVIDPFRYIPHNEDILLIPVGYGV